MAFLLRVAATVVVTKTKTIGDAYHGNPRMKGRADAPALLLHVELELELAIRIDIIAVDGREAGDVGLAAAEIEVKIAAADRKSP
jgi:hypothetical protein